MVDYELVVNYFDTALMITIAFAAVVSFYYLIYFFTFWIKDKKYPEGKIKYKYAVLIPARNEDKVISNILNSLKNQTYPADKFDVYVIIESKDDPTYNIVKKFGYNVVIRKVLTNRQTKGFALQDCINEIKESGKKYDAYMIFDADNVLNSNYLSLMNDVKNQGFQIGLGYRNFTNANKNWISATCAIMFTFMCSYTSKGRSLIFKKVTLMGTGYYVDTDIVDDAGGWIWTGMTEDTELTTYAFHHNISMHYYPYAVYYDEQPTTYKVMHNQHIRWIYGFIGNKKPFKKHKPLYNDKNKLNWAVGLYTYEVGIWPFVIFIVLQLLALITVLVLFILACVTNSQEKIMWVGLHLVLNFILFYGVFVLVGLLTVIKERKNLKLSFKTALKGIFGYFFYFVDFVFALLDGAVHPRKRSLWTKIEHKGEIMDKRAIEDSSNG
ncbi:MAG: glycosyltransferase family 2 protein [Bacilli bacterium]|nr:glycosyltransferase family 2 protein [Bacilli bacterium]